MKIKLKQITLMNEKKLNKLETKKEKKKKKKKN